MALRVKALSLAERNFGPDHPMTGDYLHSLGIAELDLGDYAAAKRHFQQALTVYEAR